jgi:hypothetical protein
VKRYILILFSLIFLSVSGYTQSEKNSKLLLIRCDDIGMSHSVNLAAKELIDSGLKFSASVMFACNWYQEAVEILKSHPEISVGIHLTLNSEWKNYKWGPVSGAGTVPSLVDSNGYFFPSRESFFANNPSLVEVETELRAQIERARQSGIKIYYLDYHMGTAVETPEMRAIVEKLAKEYNLGISRYFGEVDLKSMYSIPVDEKECYLKTSLSGLDSSKVNLLVCHIGIDNDELSALIDENSFGLKEMSKHRESELKALISFSKINSDEEYGLTLINYEELINAIGLENMKSPFQAGY